MRKIVLLLAVTSVLLVGCAPSRVSTLDSANGGMAAAYHGKIEDMLVDLRAILIRFSPGLEPEFVDEGIVKGYKHPYAKYRFVPVKGITDRGVAVDAYAFEVFFAPGPGAIGYYTKLKPELDAKYPLVRVK